MFGLLVRGLVALVSWIGNAIGRKLDERALSAGPIVPAFLARDRKTLLDGILVELSTAGTAHTGGPYATAQARPESGTVPRLLRDHQWGERDRPAAAAALAALTVRDDETRGDDDAASALPTFAASWERLRASVEHAIVVSDGDTVTGWIVADRQEQVDLLAATVAAIARWDVAVARLLASLPDARPLHDDRLSPAILLPGDVRVGLRGKTLVVALDPVTRTVDRDPARILATVAELRANRGGVPFR